MSKTIYRVETRFGYYMPFEKIGEYEFPENIRATFQGAKTYSKVQASKVVAKLRNRGIDCNLHESTC